MQYFDSHTHLQFSAYEDDRKEVLARALEAGVGMINVGTLKSTSKDGVRLANAHKNKHIYSAVGIHPTHASSSFHDTKEVANQKKKDSRWEYNFFKKLSEEDKVVAIGECGLDYFRLDKNDHESKEIQKDLFKKHIELAKEVNMPLMVHCRPSRGSQDAYQDLYEIIKTEADNIPSVVIHFFVGNKEMANKFLDLGFSFTFGGVITFTNDYDEVVKNIPIDNILLETDAPYVSPAPHRGKRNEPAFVIEVYKKVTKLKSLGIKDLQKKMISNNEKVFGINLS